jgi:hypothetical protein
MGQVKTFRVEAVSIGFKLSTFTNGAITQSFSAMPQVVKQNADFNKMAK